jgi:hypothetical protein
MPCILEPDARCRLSHGRRHTALVASLSLRLSDALTLAPAWIRPRPVRRYLSRSAPTAAVLESSGLPDMDRGRRHRYSAARLRSVNGLVVDDWLTEGCPLASTL